jgi:nitrite reductase/ring-hydroxylating ferredoxin subunit
VQEFVFYWQDLIPRIGDVTLQSGISRRTLLKRFIGWVGLLFSALIGYLAIHLTTSPRRNEFHGEAMVGSVAQFGGNGPWSLEVDGFAIMVYKGEDGQFAGLSRQCTHKSCTVRYRHTANELVCVCHGSRFDITGQPLSGPANLPLMRLEVEIRGKDVIIRA